MCVIVVSKSSHVFCERDGFDKLFFFSMRVANVCFPPLLVNLLYFFSIV